MVVILHDYCTTKAKNYVENSLSFIVIQVMELFAIFNWVSRGFSFRRWLCVVF